MYSLEAFLSSVQRKKKIAVFWSVQRPRRQIWMNGNEEFGEQQFLVLNNWAHMLNTIVHNGSSSKYGRRLTRLIVRDKLYAKSKKDISGASFMDSVSVLPVQCYERRPDSLVVAGQLTMIYAIRCGKRKMWPHSFTPKHADTSAKNKYKAKKILKIFISTVATGRSICCDLFFFYARVSLSILDEYMNRKSIVPNKINDDVYAEQRKKTAPNHIFIYTENGM